MKTLPDSSRCPNQVDIYAASAIIMDAQFVVPIIENAMKELHLEMFLHMTSWSALVRLSQLPRHIRDEIDAQAAGELCLAEEILAQALRYCAAIFAQDETAYSVATRLYQAARQIRTLIHAYHIVR